MLNYVIANTIQEKTCIFVVYYVGLNNLEDKYERTTDTNECK